MNKYQEALDRIVSTIIEEEADGYLEPRTAGDFCWESKNILQELVDKAESFEWIPVSERLPETINEDSESDYNIFDVYLVSIDEKSRPILALWDGRCFCDAMYRMLLGVKAWMPLPEPYKENENETR